MGRVITALVEHREHIPYRESNLTRLLQDSLGGKTKTTIIATVSPAQSNIEETLSTLDYANKAKSIKNKPEVNQKLVKQALIKEYTEEIDKLKQQLSACREKNGIYLPEEQYNKMEYTINTQREEIRELTQRISVLTEELEKLTNLFTDIKHELDTKNIVLKQTEENLKAARISCSEFQEECNVKEFMLNEKAKVENALFGQAEQLEKEKNDVEKDLKTVFNKLDAVNEIALTNINNVNIFTKDMESNYQIFSSTGTQMNAEIHANLDAICVNLDKTKHEVWSVKEKNKNSLRAFEKSLLEWLKEKQEFVNDEYLIKMNKFKEAFLKESESHSNERDLKLKTFLETINEQFLKLKEEGIEKMFLFINELSDKKELFIKSNIELQMKNTFLKENMERIAENYSGLDQRLQVVEKTTSSINEQMGELKQLDKACTKNLSKIFELLSDTMSKRQSFEEKFSLVEKQNAQNSLELSEINEENKKRGKASMKKLSSDFRSLIELPILEYLNSSTQIVDKV